MENEIKAMLNQKNGKHNQVKAQAILKNEQRCKTTKQKSLKCLKFLTLYKPKFNWECVQWQTQRQENKKYFKN